MRKKHRNTLIVFFILYALTFLPNFGIFNSLTWIGPVTLPLFWVLLINVVNTVIIFYIYFKFFKPFAKRTEKEMREEENEKRYNE